MANRARGQVDITIDGKAYPVAMTLDFLGRDHSGADARAAIARSRRASPSFARATCRKFSPRCLPAAATACPSSASVPSRSTSIERL